MVDHIRETIAAITDAFNKGQKVALVQDVHGLQEAMPAGWRISEGCESTGVVAIRRNV